MRTPTLRACRIALNYIPVWFGAFFALGFLLILVGLRPNALITGGLWVGCFVALVAWLRRCALLMTGEGSLVVVNPRRQVRFQGEDVVKLKEHTFRLGKDRCPLLVTRDHGRIPLVVATGEPMDLARWRELTSD
jgi:hypothetical protein